MSAPRITLDQWAALVAVVEAGGYAAASRKLHPGDMAMTLYRQLGIGTTQLTQIGVLPPGEVVEELLG